jgi:hypothetical protein
MSEPIASYEARVSGLWNTRHRIFDRASGEALGVLTVERNGSSMVVRGTWRPEKGDVLSMRRDPGLLRSHFSLWTEGREWLGSSLRWSSFTRDIEVSAATANKPYVLSPLPGLRRGWRLIAPKTGEALRIGVPLIGRRARIDVWRRLDFELVVFAYFLGFPRYAESVFPGPVVETGAPAGPVKA